ncbi:MAG: hypothetical protein VKK07_00935 [Merismopediaceae bacterium]|nr:hypothetical protein [Merismopediaceae bacterium]
MSHGQALDLCPRWHGQGAGGKPLYHGKIQVSDPSGDWVSRRVYPHWLAFQ